MTDKLKTASAHNKDLTGRVEPEETQIVRCTLCGEPMPPGEEMFLYHGYSGDCPKPPPSAETVRAVSDGLLILGLKNTERLMKEKAALESSLSRAQERESETVQLLENAADSLHEAWQHLDGYTQYDTLKAEGIIRDGIKKLRLATEDAK